MMTVRSLAAHPHTSGKLGEAVVCLFVCFLYSWRVLDLSSRPKRRQLQDNQVAF